MSTRAGAVGLLTGLIASVINFLLFIIQPDAFLGTSATFMSYPFWIAVVVTALMIIIGGWRAARRSGSVLSGRLIILGALAGSLAGVVIFCLWGAALAGQAMWFLPERMIAGVDVSKVVLIEALILRTQYAFLALFLGGAGMGGLGGWCASLQHNGSFDTFDRADPQMVLNASITAVPASMLAVAVAAAAFNHLPEGVSENVAKLPLITALLILVVGHLALTLVIPHETGHALHRCGMDEIKMAAYVGIVTAPVLLIVLIFTNIESLSYPLVMVSVLVCWVMSLVNLLVLIRVVLPRRALFPAPQDEKQKKEATLFGTIAFSNARRLVVLCSGCGLAMALPLYLSVLSVLINLANAKGGSGVNWGLFKAQMLASVGISAAAVAVLVLIYMFYLNLGRWWKKNKI